LQRDLYAILQQNSISRDDTIAYKQPTELKIFINLRAMCRTGTFPELYIRLRRSRHAKELSKFPLICWKDWETFKKETTTEAFGEKEKAVLDLICF
jgi:hypothetical protein